MYKRILLKLSGESLQGEQKYGISLEQARIYAQQIKEAHELGINDSIVHEDFMIGTADMNITAVCADGHEVAIFKDGEWAF